MLRAAAVSAVWSAAAAAAGTCANGASGDVCLNQLSQGGATIAKDQVLLQRRKAVLASVKRHDSSQNVTSSSSSSSSSSCCAGCTGRAFCSPGSGNCYDTKKKHYYKSCTD